MSRRDRRMPFAKWVDTHVHYLRAPRLQAIMTLLASGPRTSRVVQERLARASRPTHMHASAGLRVTIDTIQRDLKLLVTQGYLQTVDWGDRYEWGGGRHLIIWRYKISTDTLV